MCVWAALVHTHYPANCAQGAHTGVEKCGGKLHRPRLGLVRVGLVRVSSLDQLEESEAQPCVMYVGDRLEFLPLASVNYFFPAKMLS